MSSDRYARILRAVRAQPWAILPEALDLVVEILDRRIEGVALSAEEIDQRIEAARRPAPASVAAPGAIAVIPVHGILSHRMHMVSNVSQTGTSAEALTLAFRRALDDPGISAIVLDVDSPGGSVFGIQELADTIANARGRKPVVAVANSLAASAAYWIASQADELVVTPGGQVGSIGVIAAHDDVSKAAEAKGLKRTYVTAGKYKAEGNPYEPLGDEARATMQEMVDAYYERFVAAVARGRGVTASAVEQGFGQGRVVVAAEAVRRGMADREETLQAAIDRLATSPPRGAAPARAEAGEAEPSAPPADLEAARARLRLAAAARRA